MFEESQAQFYLSASRVALGLELNPKLELCKQHLTPNCCRWVLNSLFSWFKLFPLSSCLLQGLCPNRRKKTLWCFLLHPCFPAFLRIPMDQLLKTTPTCCLFQQLLNMWNCKKLPKMALFPLQSQESELLAGCSWRWQPKQTQGTPGTDCSDKKQLENIPEDFVQTTVSQKHWRTWKLRGEL